MWYKILPNNTIMKPLGKSGLLKKLCHCIKLVRKTVKAIRGQRESAAIGICVKSVLHRRGKTIKRFSCKKKELITRKKKELTTRKKN
jgi:hypothetical protein